MTKKDEKQHAAVLKEAGLDEDRAAVAEKIRKKLAAWPERKRNDEDFFRFVNVLTRLQRGDRVSDEDYAWAEKEVK